MDEIAELKAKIAALQALIRKKDEALHKMREIVHRDNCLVVGHYEVCFLVSDALALEEPV